MIDLGFLRQLLDLLNESNAQTIEIRKWSTSIRISKGGTNAGAPATYHVNAAPAPLASVPVREVAGPAPEPMAKATNLLEIKSPMVGTFYAQPEPGADPYVRNGTRVKPGDTLCIIEAMKIMNPLDSEVAGTIVEVLADDAAPVEFGQVLFRVDPNA
ncbi:MAG TPA: acetyl-CoA carboxylase biotin carboxyl carrier protein [Gemmatimonadales bacterium]